MNMSVKECNIKSNYVKKTKNRQFSISSCFIDGKQVNCNNLCVRCDSHVQLNMNMNRYLKVSKPDFLWVDDIISKVLIKRSKNEKNQYFTFFARFSIGERFFYVLTKWVKKKLFFSSSSSSKAIESGTKNCCLLLYCRTNILCFGERNAVKSQTKPNKMKPQTLNIQHINSKFRTMKENYTEDTNPLQTIAQTGSNSCEWLTRQQ